MSVDFTAPPDSEWRSRLVDNGRYLANCYWLHHTKATIHTPPTHACTVCLLVRLGLFVCLLKVFHKCVHVCFEIHHKPWDSGGWWDQWFFRCNWKTGWVVHIWQADSNCRPFSQWAEWGHTAWPLWCPQHSHHVPFPTFEAPPWLLS